jgi:hypothetical protein
MRAGASTARARSIAARGTLPLETSRRGAAEVARARRVDYASLVNARVRKVVEEFLELSEDERALAVAQIEASIEGDDSQEDVEKAWAEVIQRRAREVLEGRSKGRDAFEVLDEIEARLRAQRG